jgi:hypothetical protein
MADPESTPYIPESGMPVAHFEKFVQAAKEQGVIAIVRNTNTASVPLIEKGCPGKPLDIKFHTSELTGVVTAANNDEIAHARKLGYLVVDKDLVARGQPSPAGKPTELKLTNPFWKVLPGQIIDAAAKKPLVGDYDLMGVVKPSNPGQNIALVASEGEVLKDVSSPIVRRFANAVNGKLDRPRVLHGAQDQYSGFRGSATAFLPNGKAVLLPDEYAVKGFYEIIGRQTRLGSYNPRLIQTIPGRSFMPQQTGMKGVLGDHAVMAAAGVMLGEFAQWLGDIGISRRIDEELKTTHAAAIQTALASGKGVLIIVRLQEWAQPDFNGMRARGYLGVYVQPGFTQNEALERWNQPKFINLPPEGWRAIENYVWVDPKK